MTKEQADQMLATLRNIEVLLTCMLNRQTGGNPYYIVPPSAPTFKDGEFSR